MITKFNSNLNDISLPHESTEEEDYREIKGGRGPLLSRGEEKHVFTIREGRKKREKEEEEGLNFSKKTTSTCYPLGQFSTYRLDKISSPPPKPHPHPQFPVFGGKLDPPIGE